MIVTLGLLYLGYLHHVLTLDVVMPNSSEGSPVNSSRGYQYYHEALTSGESNATNDFDWRIWRGNNIFIEQAPYTVLYGWFCGGALVKSRWVITAAHCDEEYFVHAGSHIREETKEYPIDLHKYHPNWSGSKDHDYDYDVLLLRIQTFVPVSNTARPIQIGTGGYVGETLFVNGWGHDTYVFNLTKGKSLMSDRLRQVRMTYLDHKDCAERALPEYASKLGENKTITPRMECAESTEGSPCFGDYGGPVVGDNKLVGVASWGIHCEPLLVFTNLSPLRDWIDKILGGKYTT